MDHQERVAFLFDQLAGEYDRVGVEFFQPIAAGLVAELDPRPGERAVDIGCGRGAVLLPLAAAVGRSGSVVGLDISPRMVEAAAAEAAGASLDVEVLIGDAAAPRLPNESFDLLASSLVLFFLPDPLAALRAWRDLLVAGGRVGVTTFGPYSDQWRDEVDAVLRGYAKPDVADARTSGQRGPFASDEGMEALFREAGFQEVRTAKSKVSPRFNDAEHWFRWSMSVGQRQFWEAIAENDRSEVKAKLLTAVNQCRVAGTIGFDQEVRYTLAVR